MEIDSKSTRIYELAPNNGRKSFYGKAHVIETPKMRYLLSYDTIIAGVERSSGKVHKYSDYHSYTTGSHVIAFFGGKGKAKEFWALPTEKRNTSINIKI